MEERNINLRLHTDGLEAKYGKVTARILEHTDEQRVIDIVDQLGISRTHAITWFPESMVNDPIGKVRDEIKHGGLAGKSFKQNGFNIVKNHLENGIIEIPVQIQKSFATESEHAHFQIYEFWAIKKDEKYLFGIIAEIVSPDFLPVKDVLHTNDETGSYTDRLLKYLNRYNQVRL